MGIDVNLDHREGKARTRTVLIRRVPMNGGRCDSRADAAENPSVRHNSLKNNKENAADAADAENPYSSPFNDDDLNALAGEVWS